MFFLYMRMMLMVCRNRLKLQKRQRHSLKSRHRCERGIHVLYRLAGTQSDASVRMLVDQNIIEEMVKPRRITTFHTGHCRTHKPNSVSVK